MSREQGRVTPGGTPRKDAPEPQAARSRRPYAQPSLRFYGSLTTLTRGAGGAFADMPPTAGSFTI